MTSVIRHVKNTTTATNVNTEIASTGSDHQLIAFDITTAAAIAAGANADILTWTGAGKIMSIVSFFVRSNAGVINAPIAANPTSVVIDATGKKINIAIAANGTPVVANSTISMLLVIGNY